MSGSVRLFYKENLEKHIISLNKGNSPRASMDSFWFCKRKLINFQKFIDA